MADDYKEFEANILKLTGIDLNSYKERQMKRRLDFLLEKSGRKNYAEYFSVLKSDNKELQSFKSYMTINVSEFFRNSPQWETLEKKILPELLKNKADRSLNIWSAACSTGDEPYSLAMLISEKYPGVKFNILATDIDEDIIAKAKIGEYNFKSIEKISKVYIDKYFTKTEYDYYKISDSIKKNITFKKHDLIRDAYFNNMDIIVCRNVVIYFTEEVKDEMYSKFSKVLDKGKILFIGNTEQIMNASAYNFEHLEDFFYKKV